MKRAILLSAVMSSMVMSYGQQVVTDGTSERSPQVLVAAPTATPVEAMNTNYAPTSAPKQSQAKHRAESYDFVKIGTTYYDLQTNAAIGRRAILHDDGTVTVAWTFSSTSSTTWPDRGSAVNHYDGTSWGAFPNTRTESSIRTGWPSIGMLPDGSIYTIAHDAADGGLIMVRNTGKGKTDWVSDSKKVLEHPDGNMIWNRTANIGDTMFSIVNFSAQADDEDVIINGIANPTLYSRSLDGGVTWSALDLLPGYDSARYLEGAGDTYAIDVNGSTVAIIIGGARKDLTLFKSTDRGDNWTTTIIDSFAIPRFEFGKHFVDPQNPAVSNDGGIDVLIDNNGDVHVTSGRVSYSDDDTTDDLASSGYYYGLYHWSENQPEWKICGNLIDMDGLPSPTNPNSPFDITRETMNSMGADGNPSNGLGYAARYGGTSASTHSSMSVDKNNNIYVTWDAPVEQTYNDYLANYRDVHITFSTDGGATWATTQNATQVRSQEAVFACLTKRTDDFVHFVFQMDQHPGTNLQNSGTGNLHPNVENTIYYAAIPVQDLMDSVLGQNTANVKPVMKESKVFVVSQNQPNPFSETTEVIVYLRAGSDLTCTVTDATGKIVSVQDMGYKSAGNHKLAIDGTELTSGVYFYTLQTKDSEITKKMQVLK